MARWPIVVLVMIAALVFFFVVPPLVGMALNRVGPPPGQPPADVRRYHDTLFVADLHADTLLWARNPIRRGYYGHVDLPRLVAGGMSLQVFSAVTKSPRGLNFERNDADSDTITALVIAQRWPPATWTDLTERALHQAERLRRLDDDAGDAFAIIENRTDLDRLVAARKAGRRTVGGVLAIEGLHAAEGEIERLRRLHAAGYRMMGLTHFFDNAVGGSAHGIEKGGLTAFGRTAIAEMERLGIMVDLAHASPRLVDDVLDVATQPVVVSHTGVKATCARTRNLSDDQVRRVAANGGVIGIAFFGEAVCGGDVHAIVAAIRHVVALAGVAHVALGSDFDGAVRTPFDATGMPLVTDALLRSGLDRDAIAAIMGGNVLNVLRRTLPRGRSADTTRIRDGSTPATAPLAPDRH